MLIKTQIQKIIQRIILDNTPTVGFEPTIPKELAFEASAIPDYATLAQFSVINLLNKSFLGQFLY